MGDDTTEEKATALNDCSKCKYSGVCELYQNILSIKTYTCIIGVK